MIPGDLTSACPGGFYCPSGQKGKHSARVCLPWGPHLKRSTVHAVHVSVKTEQKNVNRGRLGGSVRLSIRLLVSAQVVISGLVSSSPTWGVQTVLSLLGVLCLPLSPHLPYLYALSRALWLKNKEVNPKNVNHRRILQLEETKTPFWEH